MTAADRPSRPRLDHMTDDDLDKLYARLDALEQPAPASLRDQYTTAISKWHRDPEQPLYTQGADAVLAVRDTEMQQLRGRIAELEVEAESLQDRVDTLEHVAASNKRHVQAILPDLWAAQAAVDRVRALHQPTPGAGFGPDDDPTPGAYGHIAQACTSCGTADEFAVRWPCPTIRALDGPARPEPAPDDTDGHDWSGSRDPWICRNCRMDHRRWHIGWLTGRERQPCPGPGPQS